jgi:hypothetical protein
MCHREWRRLDERPEERRGERLWDLFYRETEEPVPPMPVAEREEVAEREREEALTGAAHPANDGD